MSNYLMITLISSLAISCASGPSSRSPNQEFNVNLKDSSGRTVAPNNTRYSGRTTVSPSDEETRKQAEAMKSAVAKAVEKAEANHDRVTGTQSQTAASPTENSIPLPVASSLAVKNESNQNTTTTPNSSVTPTAVSSKALVTSVEPLPTQNEQSSSAPIVTHKGLRVAGPVPAEQSLKWLKNGNRRFIKGFLRNDGASSKDRERVAKKQSPHAIVITSSDSRVPPELIFDQKLGEIFVLRLANKAVDTQVQRSLAEGVGQLGANMVVVLGVNSLLNWENPKGMAHEISENSKILREAIASGGVKVVPALYNLETGSITWSE